MTRFIVQTLILFTLTLAADGQSELAAATEKKCFVGTESFSCPAGLKIEDSGSPRNPFVGTEMRSNTTVFAFEIDIDSQDQAIEETTARVIKSRYGVSFDTFKTKISNDFWGSAKFSSYETKRFAIAGLNASINKAFHSHRVVLSYKGKVFLVGFFTDLDRRQNAEESFEKWNGGGIMYATYALQNLINSITGEKIKDYEAPGGPPPMAAPPKKPN